jgi:hypothetical protein
MEKIRGSIQNSNQKDMSDKPVMHRASFEFYQEGNTDGTTDDTEELKVECMGIGDLSEGCYYVLRTQTGWSVDSPEELKQLLERVDKMMKI